jgi:hypothetical protein
MASWDQRSSWPRKDHRHGDEPSGTHASQRVEAWAWSADALAHGTRITSTGFPKDSTVPLCRREVSPHRPDDVVPNDQAQEATEAPREGGAAAGKASRGPVQGHRGPGGNAASAAKHASNALRAAVLVWCGAGSQNSRHHQAARCINAHTDCWMMTSCSNSGIHRSG